MNLEFWGQYFIPVITGICLCLGYVIKSWVKDVDNKYIPTINAVIGLGLAVWMHWPGITPEVALGGLFSGLAATGLYETLRNLIGGKQNG